MISVAGMLMWRASIAEGWSVIEGHKISTASSCFWALEGRSEWSLRGSSQDYPMLLGSLVATLLSAAPETIGLTTRNERNLLPVHLNFRGDIKQGLSVTLECACRTTLCSWETWWPSCSAQPS